MNERELKVIEIVAEIIEVEKETLTLDSARKEIEEWDSLSHVQIIAELEDAFGVSIPIEKVNEVRTIRDFVEFVG